MANKTISKNLGEEVTVAAHGVRMIMTNVLDQVETLCFRAVFLLRVQRDLQRELKLQDDRWQPRGIHTVSFSPHQWAKIPPEMSTNLVTSVNKGVFTKY